MDWGVTHFCDYNLSVKKKRLEQVAENRNLKVGTRSSVPEEETQFIISPLFSIFFPFNNSLAAPPF